MIKSLKPGGDFLLQSVPTCVVVCNGRPIGRKQSTTCHASSRRPVDTYTDRRRPLCKLGVLDGDCGDTTITTTAVPITTHQHETFDIETDTTDPSHHSQYPFSVRFPQRPPPHPHQVEIAAKAKEYTSSGGSVRPETCARKSGPGRARARISPRGTKIDLEIVINGSPVDACFADQA